MKSLTSIILKNSKRTDRKENQTKREKLLTVISFYIVFVFLAVLMTAASYYVTTRLEEIEQTYAFVNILLLLNFFLLFAKSIFEGLNVLYFSKDLKILLRMPIKPKDILNAKLINMITSEYQLEFIMLAIPMIVYGIFTKVNFLFYLYMTIVLLILPVIPILLTSLVISVIMRFTNSIKNKNKVMYLTIFISIFLVGIITSAFELNIDLSVSNFENIILETNGLTESISNAFILIKPIMNTLLNYDNIDGFKNLIIYILESLVCYVSVVFLMSKIYLKGAIGTTINSSKRNNHLSEDLKLIDFQKKTKNMSYLSKESKILFRTPIFFLQCIIMPIVYPILVFGISVFLIGFSTQVGIDAIGKIYERLSQTSGQAIILSIGQVFYMMNFCSIIAVSRESKNSIICKYIPIKLDKQFHLKLKIGEIINSISSIMVSICYFICTQNIAYTIIVLAILILLNLICEKFKLLIDLKKPQISWDNEYTMMKQNTNVMYELFYTLIIIGILLAISAIIKNIGLFLIFVLFICIITNVAINEYVYKKQKIIFAKVF